MYARRILELVQIQMYKFNLIILWRQEREKLLSK